MIVPFADIPAKFLSPLNVETKVNYTLDMKKFPGLSSDAPPALVIAQQKNEKNFGECERVACPDPNSCSTNKTDCAYSSCSITPTLSLVNAQRELFHLLDSYQLDYSGTDVSRGNMLDSVPFPSPVRQPENCCRSLSSQSNLSLTPCRFSGRQTNTAREKRDKAARKFVPYSTGKYKNPCSVVSCDRISTNTSRPEQNLNSISCFLSGSGIHQNHANYSGPYMTKSQRPCSVNNSVNELTMLQYNCPYSYSHKKLDCGLNSFAWNVPKVPLYDNPFYSSQWDTSYADIKSLQQYNSHLSTVQKENIWPFPTLMV